jgi:hypothetical protein
VCIGSVRSLGAGDTHVQGGSGIGVWECGAIWEYRVRASPAASLKVSPTLRQMERLVDDATCCLFWGVSLPSRLLKRCPKKIKKYEIIGFHSNLIIFYNFE